jgi:hypothetical protein
MEIAVFLSGAITSGLDSPTAGEGRWGQNLSRMLSMYGHNVDCFSDPGQGHPSWGRTVPIPNVALSAFHRTNKQYDIVLYMPWEHQYNRGWQYPHEPCLTMPLKAKWYAHFTFSWAASIPGDHTCYNNNHVLAYPYIQEAHQFPPYGDENPYRVYPLPIPIYTELSTIAIEKRKDLLWSTKDVFHPDWGSVEHHVPAIGMRTLRAIKRLSEKYTFNTHFLSTTYFHSVASSVAKSLGVEDFVRTIPNARFYDLIPRRDLLEIMGGCRLTTIVSGLLGSFGDSIASGSIPLCYNGHIYRAAALKHGLVLDTFHAKEEDIYSCMERLYTDDALFLEVLKDYREEMRYYSYKASYEYFRTMVKDLFGEDYTGV